MCVRLGEFVGTSSEREERREKSIIELDSIRCCRLEILMCVSHSLLNNDQLHRAAERDKLQFAPTLKCQWMLLCVKMSKGNRFLSFSRSTSHFSFLDICTCAMTILVLYIYFFPFNLASGDFSSYTQGEWHNFLIHITLSFKLKWRRKKYRKKCQRTWIMCMRVILKCWKKLRRIRCRCRKQQSATSVDLKLLKCN